MKLMRAVRTAARMSIYRFQRAASSPAQLKGRPDELPNAVSIGEDAYAARLGALVVRHICGWAPEDRGAVPPT